jgi:hypothetical protein
MDDGDDVNIEVKRGHVDCGRGEWRTHTHTVSPSLLETFLTRPRVVHRPRPRPRPRSSSTSPTVPSAAISPRPPRPSSPSQEEEYKSRAKQSTQQQHRSQPECWSVSVEFPNPFNIPGYPYTPPHHHHHHGARRSIDYSPNYSRNRPRLHLETGRRPSIKSRRDPYEQLPQGK